MKSLIIGMGIGQLYLTVLKTIGSEVITVDTNENAGAQYASVDSALEQHPFFDTVHICTPNFTHYDLAMKVAPCAKIVFVEKPGVATAEQWLSLLTTFPKTRFMMVKNNQWRDEFVDYKKLAQTSDTVLFKWINRNRVPKPGSWFTDKKLAFGGVSRDLLPHLLSYYTGFFPDFAKSAPDVKLCKQRWQIKDLTDSDYGAVDPNGHYDVDDRVELEINHNGKLLFFIADWRSNDKDDIGLTFIAEGGARFEFELGLCPESAYETMIRSALDNLNNSDFWQQHIKQDLWIHEAITNVNAS